MKFTTPIVAILSVALLAVDCSAEPPGRRGERGKPGAGQRRGPGQGQGQKPGAGQQRDPAQMVARMMQEFDKDGDQKLNLQELTAMMKSMRERRENGGRPGMGQGPGNGQKPGNRQGRQGRRGDGNGPAGGEKPKRPPAE